MKRHIFTLICCVVLCFTVTFAWILSGEPIKIDSLMFDYYGDNMLSISSIGVSVEIWFLQGDEYVAPQDFDFNSVVLTPHTKIPFKIYFDYQATGDDAREVPIRLSLVGIKVSDPLLLDALFIGVAPDEALNQANGQGGIYKCFNQAVASGEGDSATYRLDIYGSSNKLFVPHNDKMDLVNPWDEGTRSSLECYFYLDPQVATEAFQDMTFKIGFFRVEQ